MCIDTRFSFIYFLYSDPGEPDKVLVSSPEPINIDDVLYFVNEKEYYKVVEVIRCIPNSIQYNQILLLEPISKIDVLITKPKIIEGIT